MDGNVLTTSEEQLKRWVQHFEQLLNRPTPSIQASIPPAEPPLDISCEPPTREEIQKAIKPLKMGKSAGPDNIPAEALKADIETSTVNTGVRQGFLLSPFLFHRTSRGPGFCKRHHNPFSHTEANARENYRSCHNIGKVRTKHQPNQDKDHENQQQERCPYYHQQHSSWGGFIIHLLWKYH